MVGIAVAVVVFIADVTVGMEGCEPLNAASPHPTARLDGLN